jgi:hypothetical protein
LAPPANFFSGLRPYKKRERISRDAEFRRYLKLSLSESQDFAIVPAGRLIIARQFIAGYRYEMRLRPKGTLERVWANAQASRRDAPLPAKTRQ